MAFMRKATQRKAAHACARALCAALALFALLLLRIDARAEADGVLRVRLARLGAPLRLSACPRHHAPNMPASAAYFFGETPTALVNAFRKLL